MTTGTFESANVEVMTNGWIYVAPAGTALPTAGGEVLDAAFKHLGYLSEDGITESQETESSEIVAHNGDTVRSSQTSHNVTYQFTAIETNAVTLEAYYGHYDGGQVDITGVELARSVWVIDIVDGDQLRRRVLPSAQVTERGEVTFNNEDPTGYEMTITGYPTATYPKVRILPPVAYPIVPPAG
jgi:hypothetical protein